MPQETDKEQKKRLRETLKRLHLKYPEAVSALHHRTPLEMLVATILSAQCLDKTVNEVTPALFKQYKTARDYARADQAELEHLIHRTGFFRNKAKNLIGMGKTLGEEFGGEVPQTMGELIRLPGVARKTANVVLGAVWGIAEGVVVDTHVKRITYRLGLTEQTDPEKIEKELMALLPQQEWIFYGEAIILHGRETCVARKPKCPVCGLEGVCPKVGVQSST